MCSISDERIPRNCGTLIDECRIERKLSKKCKIKEPSFQSVNGKVLLTSNYIIIICNYREVV